MTAYVALLRGVNVGGRGKLGMSDLRELVAELGYADVTTYIQSGNVVFTTSQRSPAKIESLLEATIAANAGVDTTVCVRAAKDLRQLVADNPFGRKRLDPTHLVVVFLKTKPKRQGPIDVSRYGPEQVIAKGRELFIHYPNGQGRSKLTNAVLERELATAGTARNWNTVNKLLELAEEAT